jgi:hypothetical protein
MFLRHKSLVLCLVLAALAAGSLAAQEPVMRCDPPAGALANLSKAQKKTFMHSQSVFVAGHFADALGELRALLAQVPLGTPAQTALAERAAEAAIEAGDQATAITLLKPIEAHDGNDCLAHTLLARADAETGNSAERDAEITILTTLHQMNPNSPAGKLDGFELEKHIFKSGDGVAIGYLMHPTGPHHTHLTAEIADPSGNPLLMIELDSDDGDQVYFRETHPDLAAKGDRRYSLDAFFSDKLLQDSQGDHHRTIQFYDGLPSYDVVRERILAIADSVSNLPPGKS